MASGKHKLQRGLSYPQTPIHTPQWIGPPGPQVAALQIGLGRIIKTQEQHSRMLAKLIHGEKSAVEDDLPEGMSFPVTTIEEQTL